MTPADVLPGFPESAKPAASNSARGNADPGVIAVPGAKFRRFLEARIKPRVTDGSIFPDCRGLHLQQGRAKVRREPTDCQQLGVRKVGDGGGW